MSYRQPTYQPLAPVKRGPPLRPFNSVQWLGVLLEVGGIVVMLAHFAARIGWLPAQFETGPLGFIAMALGTTFIKSRRAEPQIVDEVQARRNRYWLVITCFGLVLVAVVALTLDAML